MEWNLKEIEPIFIDRWSIERDGNIDIDYFIEGMKEFFEEECDIDLSEYIEKFSWLKEILD